MELAIDTETISVLILDDEESDFALIERILRRVDKYDVTATHAVTIEQTLARLGEQEPDIILLDYRLGPITGLDALVQIQDSGYTVPIILMTGQGCEEIAAAAFRAGASDYFSKSAIGPENLERAMGNAIEKQKLREMIDKRSVELEETNAQLQQKTNQIASFFHTLSHELKTPLTSTREFISIIADGIAGPTTKEQREYLGIAKDGCDLLKTYINDILDITRIETGKLSIDPSRHNLSTIVKSALTVMGPEAKQKNMQVVLQQEREEFDVCCDPARITQVLVNLLGNALKFSEEGSSVTVAIRTGSTTNGFVRVDVVDTGRGIDIDAQAHIFDYLYQVRGGDTSSREGLGMGLYLCRELVCLHGGNIKVDSELGRGSQFSFTLPLVQ